MYLLSKLPEVIWGQVCGGIFIFVGKFVGKFVERIWIVAEALWASLLIYVGRCMDLRGVCVGLLRS